MIKRKHHYVWRRYLNQWSENDLIWCLRNGIIFRPNLMGVAQKKDFYKINELSEKDIDFLYYYIDQLPDPVLKKECKGWVDVFSKVSEMIRVLRNKWAKGVEPDIDKKIDLIIHNTEEELHSAIEVSAIHIMDKLIAGNHDVFEDSSNYIKFINYICTQYTRTNNVRQTVVGSLLTFQLADINKIWNILSHITATAISLSIIREKGAWSVVILDNQSSIPFITTDQPVINTFSAFGETPNEHDSLEFYYPLSPTVAILLTKRKEFLNTKNFIVDACQVEHYNSSMVSLAHEQIFASSENELEGLLLKVTDGK